MYLANRIIKTYPERNFKSDNIGKTLYQQINNQEY